MRETLAALISLLRATCRTPWPDSKANLTLSTRPAGTGRRPNRTPTDLARIWPVNRRAGGTPYRRPFELAPKYALQERRYIIPTSARVPPGARRVRRCWCRSPAAVVEMQDQSVPVVQCVAHCLHQRRASGDALHLLDQPVMQCLDQWPAVLFGFDAAKCPYHILHKPLISLSVPSISEMPRGAKGADGVGGARR
jgi:hypothetical protein